MLLDLKPTVLNPSVLDPLGVQHATPEPRAVDNKKRGKWRRNVNRAEIAESSAGSAVLFNLSAKQNSGQT